MSLSVIIPVLNDREELAMTSRSLRGTGFRGELVVIDDASDPSQRIPAGDYSLVLNKARQGVAKSRQLGAELASGDWLLFLDSHMRMQEDWLAEFRKLEGLEKTLINGTCLGLSTTHKDISKPIGVYAGVTLLVLDRKKKEVLEGKWAQELPDLAELPCCMGACYFIPRQFFLDIGGLRALRSWGSDEPYLSMKVWMNGGRVVQSRGVRAGHVFRDRSPYSIKIYDLVDNKYRMVRELIDDVMIKAYLCEFLGAQKDWNFAKEFLDANKDEIEADRRKLEANRKMSFKGFCEYFKLDLTQVVT